ncbi:hypothetical protein BU17DRAFT_98341 [Hysterangium stoloniferum]|nr:hypothetical protein BU17DRAFT_98341 [Hysterangium stoloniferum]
MSISTQPLNLPFSAPYPPSPQSSSLPSPPSSPGSSFSSLPSSAFSFSVPSSPPRHYSPPPPNQHESLILPVIPLDGQYQYLPHQQPQLQWQFEGQLRQNLQHQYYGDNTKDFEHLDLLIVGAKGAGKTMVAEGLAGGGIWRDCDADEENIGIARVLESGSVNVYVIEPFNHASEQAQDIVDTILEAIHVRFRSLLSMISIECPSTAKLRDLVAAPQSGLYCAVIFLASSPPTALEKTLIAALSPHIPVLPITSPTFIQTYAQPQPQPQPHQHSHLQLHVHQHQHQHSSTPTHNSTAPSATASTHHSRASSRAAAHNPNPNTQSRPNQYHQTHSHSQTSTNSHALKLLTMTLQQQHQHHDLRNALFHGASNAKLRRDGAERFLWWREVEIARAAREVDNELRGGICGGDRDGVKGIWDEEQGWEWEAGLSKDVASTLRNDSISRPKISTALSDSEPELKTQNCSSCTSEDTSTNTHPHANALDPLHIPSLLVLSVSLLQPLRDSILGGSVSTGWNHNGEMKKARISGVPASISTGWVVFGAFCAGIGMGWILAGV